MNRKRGLSYYCKTLIIRVTLFSRGHQAWFINETLFFAICHFFFYNPYMMNYWRGLYFCVSMFSRIYAKIKSSRIKSVLQYTWILLVARPFCQYQNFWSHDLDQQFWPTFEKNLTLALTFEPKEIRVSYYTWIYLIARPFWICQYQFFLSVTLTSNFDLLLKILSFELIENIRSYKSWGRGEKRPKYLIIQQFTQT